MFNRAIFRQVWKWDHAHPIETAESNITNRRGDLAGEIKLPRLTKGHRLAGIQKNSHRQLALLFVKFQEKSFKAAIKVPIQVTEIITGNVSAIIGKFDGLTARAAAAFAPRGAFGSARGEQLKLLE